MRNAFALIHTFPDLKNAEYEVVQRVLAAADLVGTSVAVTDGNGLVIWASPKLLLTEGKPLPRDAVDFVLSLHFQSPRLIDIYSYITLWQPVDFYHQFGYQTSIDAVASHNDLVSCASDIADFHGLNLLASVGRAPAMPLPQMFHTLPEPFLPPQISASSKLFYIGINWERLGRAKGRFHDTLVSFDSQDLTDIYGPQEVHGYKVWEGFQTYRGELPFDGKSVKPAVNRSGICLALSSEAHKSAGIMSNRLFEGLAGGAAIIATPNPLIDKFFRDVVYLVDDTKGETVLGQQILEAMRRIRANPAEATARVLKGQAILRGSCSLERSITTLVETNAARQAVFAQGFLASGEISVILTYYDDDAQLFVSCVEMLWAQTKVRVHLHVVCSQRFFAENEDQTSKYMSGNLVSIRLHVAILNTSADEFDGYKPPRQRTGPVVLDILKEIQTDYFTFMVPGDAIFTDHYASIIKAIQNTDGSVAGCSGVIRCSVDLNGVEMRTLESLRFVDFDSVLLATCENHVGRFVFQTSIIDEKVAYLIPLLDGEEHNYFRLAALLSGEFAQSSYATYLSGKFPNARIPLAAEPIDHQRQYIRDSFACDPRWLHRLSRSSKLPEAVYAFSPGAPIRWSQSAPHSIPPALPINLPTPIRAGGAGLCYLVGGFSTPELEHVWIEGDRGLIEFSLSVKDGGEMADLAIVLSAAGRPSTGSGRDQHCTIALNGVVISYLKVPDTVTDLTIPVPLQISGASATYRLELTPDYREPVLADDGTVLDSRLLSIMLRSITIIRRSAFTPPRFDLGAFYLLKTGEPGTAALARNFYSPEPIGVWAAGPQAELAFYIRQLPEQPVLRLVHFGRASIEHGRKQRLTVTVNEVVLASVETGAEPTELVLQVDPASLPGGLFKVTVRADHAEAIYDAQHNIVDPRLLGFGIVAIGVFDGREEEVPIDSFAATPAMVKEAIGAAMSGVALQETRSPTGPALPQRILSRLRRELRRLV